MSTSDPNTGFQAPPRPLHARALETTRRALSLAALLVSASLPAACTALSETGADGGLGAMSADELEGELMAILRALFPDLSDAELTEIVQKLDAEQILALRDELEAARDAAVTFSDDLFKSAEERVADRETALAAHNGGYPAALDAVGLICAADGAPNGARVSLSGVFAEGMPFDLDAAGVQVTVDGEPRQGQLRCARDGEPLDIVFLVDITGSMRDVIHGVRASIGRFVESIGASGVRGTLSVVTFQDTVGVDVEFQQPAPEDFLERSPFHPPVNIADADAVASLEKFVRRLEANQGADLPENLSGAIDFANSNVIGERDGRPNVIGVGGDDPPGTRPFPTLKNRRVFVAFTDATFHGDASRPGNSSLDPRFVPRRATEIAASLLRTGTVVHVSDPSWVDDTMTPAAAEVVDADFFARATGGVGEDLVAGYSLVDLELVVVAKDEGLLDIALDRIISTACDYEVQGAVPEGAAVDVTLTDGQQTTTRSLTAVGF